LFASVFSPFQPAGIANMSASIAAVALPVAAAGALAAKSVGSAIESFGALLKTSSTNKPADATSKTDAADLLKEKVSQFQQQLASRIRNSGVATDSNVEIQLDEFGLPRAFVNGQENAELSRWLSGEMDLVRQFSDLQAETGGSLAVKIDLAS
jgi:hypothetical protein